MPIKYCPYCNQSFIYDVNCGDICHDCGNQGGATEALKNEDVMVMGSWEDSTGSKTQPQQMVNMQGITNDIWGQRGAIEGARVSQRTSRGNDMDKFRTKKHSEYIKL
jgi:hypothetical protein